jgi:thiamine pyrophosphokinase
MDVAIVFAGGDRPPPRVLEGLDHADLVIAADSGLEHALALGVHVDLVVGDLVSVTPASLALARAAGTSVEQHPEAKDFTDLELALDAARVRGARRVVVLGGSGGRVDHFFANLLALARPELGELRVEARLGDADVVVVRTEVTITGTPGQLVSLLPVGGPAHRVTTVGLRYPLRGETLHPGSTRGVSNELLDTEAQVSLTGGVLLAVLPRNRKASS